MCRVEERVPQDRSFRPWHLLQRAGTGRWGGAGDDWGVPGYAFRSRSPRRPDPSIDPGGAQERVVDPRARPRDVREGLGDLAGPLIEGWMARPEGVLPDGGEKGTTRPGGN